MLMFDSIEISKSASPKLLKFLIVKKFRYWMGKSNLIIFNLDIIVGMRLDDIKVKNKKSLIII